MGASKRGAAIVSIASILLGCPGAAKDASSRPLEPYSGRATELFDDTIDPLAVGLTLTQPTDPKTDPVFRERVQMADATIRAVVTTITTKQEEDDDSAHVVIGLKTVSVIAGDHPPPPTFNVRPGKSSEGLVRTYEAGLVGKPLIVSLRLFARRDAFERGSEFHFYASPDTAEVASAVQEATALGKLR